MILLTIQYQVLGKPVSEAEGSLNSDTASQKLHQIHGV